MSDRHTAKPTKTADITGSHGVNPSALTYRGGRDFSACVLLVVATVVLYFPSLSAEFVTLDDYMYVVDNEAVRSPSIESLRRFFTEVLRPTTVEGYYQPLTMTSLMIDAWLTGGDGREPFYYHLTNIILHGLCGAAVFILIRRMAGGRAIALFVAAMFLFHPAQVESVSWISQRKNLLATLFAVAAIICYLRYGRTGRMASLLWCVLFVVLGNLAKPTVMPLPLVFVLLDVWPLRRPVIRSLGEKLIFAPIIAAAAYVAWMSQSSTAVLGTPKFESLEVVVKWLGLLCYNLVLYLGNLVWPVYLSPYRSIPTDLSISNPAVAVSMTAVAMLAIVWAISIKWSTPFFIGAAGFVVLLSPAMGGVHFAATCVGDRFLYLPTIMLLIPLATLLQRWSTGARGAAQRDTSRGAKVSRTPVLAATGCLVLLVFVVLTHVQQRVWADSRQLWFHIQTVAPDLPEANRHVAELHLESDDARAALEFARRAVAAEPDNPLYLLALGRACMRTGRAVEAKSLIEKALRLNLGRQQGFGYIALAESQIVLGDIDEAKRCIDRADAQGWSDAALIARIGETAMTIAGDCDAAIELHRMAVTRAPDDAGIRYALADRLRICGRLEESLVEYDVFIQQSRARGTDVSQVERAVAALRATMDADAGKPE